MKARIKLLVIAVVILGGLLGGSRYYFKLFLCHPQGIGPVQILMQDTAGFFNTNEYWMIGIGDSVTAGFGASPGKSYWDRLIDNRLEEDPISTEKCLKQVFRKLITTNLAQSGSTSLQHEKHQLPRIPRGPARAAIVIMTTGGNDLIHSYGKAPPKEGAMYGATWDQAQPWIELFGQRLERIATNLNALFPRGVDFFITTIYDPSDGTGALRHTGLPKWRDGTQILAAYNREILKLADRHPNVHAVDVHQAFLGHGLHAQHWWESHYDRTDPHCWLAENIEDPNDRGYDAIRRLMWNAIISHFKK